MNISIGVDLRTEEPSFHSWICSRITSRDQRWHRQPREVVEDRGEQVSRQRYLGQLESHVLRIPCDLSSDLDQLLPQHHHWLVTHPFRQGQSPQEDRQIVRKR